MGWIEARNVHLELRWFANDPERARRLARELVDFAPDAILVQSTPGIEAVREATRTIPTVFVVVANPVGNGLVTSLARPGANVTGFSTFEPEIGSKWLESLKEAAPQTRQVAVLGDPDISPFADIWRVVEAAAPTLGLQLMRAPIHTASEIEPAIAAVARTPNTAFLVIPSPLVTGQRKLIIEAAASHRVPAIYPFRFFATAGGLMSYGIDQNDIFRHGVSYVDRILKGEKPGDLPVQTPTKFEFVINLKTAKALGIAMPPSLLTRADEVIE